MYCPDTNFILAKAPYLWITSAISAKSDMYNELPTLVIATPELCLSTDETPNVTILAPDLANDFV